MNVAIRKPMSHGQFFAWAEAQDGRFEFDGERPVAMTGGSNDHSLIVVNIITELRNRLRGTSCRVMSAEGGGVATTGGKIRYPDATVTCSPVRGRDRLVPDPVVVFEVVSEGSARVDRCEKMREYQAVSSIRRYVLVEQNSPVLVSHVRDDDGFWVATPLCLGQALAMPEIGTEITVDDLFDGVSFEDERKDQTTLTSSRS